MKPLSPTERGGRGGFRGARRGRGRGRGGWGGRGGRTDAMDGKFTVVISKQHSIIIPSTETIHNCF